ncbi:hypothetical protein FRD01_07155 [Microvenator marinus]|jgi:hypothetical protein|uniref:Uncharacterized protein n=1 Tax=Microvenator marinus TaxID=2600177 RepID=A0A5B8XP50_9DELT|nr:hypothetical protein [Microvenator marinus]QED27021.1 hypothetical protein FRD01_07155 [Microvenator marinus]
MSNDTQNPFERNDTHTRLKPLNDSGLVMVVTQAFGPNGEDLIDHDGPKFSGEPGVKVRVRQGDLVEDVVLSPFYGDSSKVSEVAFKEGVPCELTVPSSGAKLDIIPGMKTEEGGKYYAIYLTPKLKAGELVAINNIWGNYNSQMLDERGLLELYADLESDE